MSEESIRSLRKVGIKTIKELETEDGILASSRGELYGCIFGRDSLISCLKLIKAHEKTGDFYYLDLIKKVLINLVKLQGKEVNLESGEQPGKCIHEFRPDKHEHLTKNLGQPWYVYKDGAMRNYDTVDATPLLLMTLHEYYRVSKDEHFIEELMPSIQAALRWVIEYGDSNGDGFIDYQFHPDRKYGGLKTQSWMDSSESIFHENREPVVYPVAPVEVQAYTYVALMAWGEYFRKSNLFYGRMLERRARELKKLFNEKFVLNGQNLSLAFAIDGLGQQLIAARSSMGHCLWAIFRNKNGKMMTILERKYISRIAKRLIEPDIFEPQAGVRTLSNLSSEFNPSSYHNGSIWPHDTAIFLEGLNNFGFKKEAKIVKNALISAYAHFKTPIELFTFKDGRYEEYRSETGQTACRKQAWSAAALLAEI